MRHLVTTARRRYPYQFADDAFVAGVEIRTDRDVAALTLNSLPGTYRVRRVAGPDAVIVVGCEIEAGVAGCVLRAATSKTLR
jgi:hypothetical protein